MTDSSAWWPAIVILLTTGVTAISAAIVYWAQKAADRKSALIELRRKSYVAFLDSLCVFAAARTSAAELQFSRCLMELSAIASAEVVKKAGNLNSHLRINTDQRTDPEVATILISELIVAIRKDCFESTDLTHQEISKISPIRP